MVTHYPVQQGYRLYLAVLAIWSVWTGVWMTFGVSVSATTIGYGWYAISIGGLVLTAGLVATRIELFADTSRSFERFSSSDRTALALGAYAMVLVVMSAISIAWWTGIVAIEGRLVGSGWLAVAGFGLLLTIGLCVVYWSDLSETADVRPIEPVAK